MYFTYHYKQPEGYHFSLDSIQLARFVAKQLKDLPELNSLRVLDLCAGCGVIGIELAWHVPEISQIDFVEIQGVYTDYFYQNIAQVNRPELQSFWHLLNYDALHEASWKNKYDLIISNPPYFQREHGMLSPSEFKNRCRFYLDSSFENYILAIANVLANTGRAYFLLRPLQQHGLDLFSEIKKLLAHTAVVAKKLASIRGTDVILMEKQSL